ncbi:MAG TPA: 4Fe-4S binding protein [Anaerolineaceae bacterium]|nr:4Fe-4S binding protein [Anaerolineaceae bacterium]HPA33912.1 4Fe-4S binding protein [Anaerolineaceae bacterium]
MSKIRSTRQRVRRALLIVAFLAFPITMNYFSPYVIIDGASQGVVNGSLVVFGLMFLSSLVLGRLWCGWACPAGALGEICQPVNDRPVHLKKLDWIKWAIWIPWIGIIVAMVIRAGGYQRVDLLLDTVNGISVAGDADRPIVFAYIIYYMVIALFAGLAMLVGRRAGCHSLCWMAPFMILGRKIRNLTAWHSLRLKASPDRCADCKTCTYNCPMSLDVNGMVKLGAMEHTECILCGTCVDNCPNHAIEFSFSKGK